MFTQFQCYLCMKSSTMHAGVRGSPGWSFATAFGKFPEKNAPKALLLSLRHSELTSITAATIWLEELWSLVSEGDEVPKYFLSYFCATFMLMTLSSIPEQEKSTLTICSGFPKH